MRLPTDIEFYTFNDEVWYRLPDGSSHRLTEDDTEMVRFLENLISELYPKAYAALEEEYGRCKPNYTWYLFRIVNRFCKCNFAIIDHIPDIESGGKVNLESVSCPLRGECRLEGVVCRPEFNHKLSEAEMRVLRLLYEGMPRLEIADRLYLSPHTVNNHIHRAYTRLNLKDTADFMKFAAEKGIFTNGLQQDRH